MCFLPGDEYFLHRALALAAAAAAFASPNPTVGCVLARDHQLLGEGAHRYDQRDHAEIAALKDAATHGNSVRGATAFVTLEPCSHQGRTGPCADALIAAGITRCVVATVDPNPLVRGNGVARLRAAGIAVTLAEPVPPVAQAARRRNDAFAFSIQHRRPCVTLKSAVSADGRLAPAPQMRAAVRSAYWLTGPAARADVQHWRHRSDALLTGVGTILADDPTLTDRSGQPRRRPLLRIVLDAHLRTPPDAKLLRSAQDDLLFFAANDASADKQRTLQQAGAQIERVPATNGRLDLDSIMAHLAAISVRSLLLEAGSTLNGALLAQDMVDELVLFQSPTILGPDALPFAVGLASPEPVLARLTGIHRINFPHGDAQDTRIQGYLHDPWQGV